MNREYTEKLFDCLPTEQRKKILRTKIKGEFPGYRPGQLHKAPLLMLKGTLKNNEVFAVRFLDAVADVYGCSSEQYANEQQLPKLTRENFWGVFARKCKELDNSQESCEILEEMIQEYEKLEASDFPNGVKGMVVSPTVSEDFGQVDSEAAKDKIDELPNKGLADKEEDYMSEFTQYIGYVQETNGYYNFWPVCVVLNGRIERFDASQEIFPELGNINLSSTPWDYVRKKCSNGEILVITIAPSDLIENKRQDGYFQRTNYKVDFNQLEHQGRIKRLEDIQMYPVLHSVGPIDFTKKTILVKEKYVDTKDPC